MTPIQFNAIGGEWVQPPLLMPSSIPLELSGEAVRSRLLTTTDGPGEELALRPDLTLAVAKMHLDQGKQEEVRYRYFGRAFRLPIVPGDAFEFDQTGFECFGHDNRLEHDVLTVSTVCEQVGALGVADSDLKLGDVSLFNAIVDTLDLSERWRTVLKRAFRRREGVQDLIDGGVLPRSSVLAQTLSQLSDADAEALLDDVLAMSGGEVIGGRSRSEILARTRRMADAGNAKPLSPGQQDVLKEAIAISDKPDAALEALWSLANTHGLDLSRRIARTERLFDGLKQTLGAIWERSGFALQFGRRFDYYDGLVFELHHAALGASRPVAAGGRYDGLITHLSGGAVSSTAVGGVIRPDRACLALVRQGSAGA